MVTFAKYTELAYEIAESKGAQLTGPGTQADNQAFIKMLAEAYNRNDHVEATEAQARSFLEDNINVS